MSLNRLRYAILSEDQITAKNLHEYLGNEHTENLKIYNLSDTDGLLSLASEIEKCHQVRPADKLDLLKYTTNRFENNMRYQRGLYHDTIEKLPSILTIQEWRL